MPEPSPDQSTVQRPAARRIAADRAVSDDDRIAYQRLRGIALVDAHHHFLATDRFPYRWLAPGTGPGRFGSKQSLRTGYDMNDYLSDFATLPLSASVHVQANCDADDPAEETRWLQELSDRHGWPTAIVAEADLTQPDAPELIERHLAYPALRGIRTPVAWDEAGRWRVASRPGVLSRPRLQRHLALLEKHALCLEMVIVAEQFDEVAALARAHPALYIVVNHLGTLEPDQPGNATAWRRGIDTLASLPNVFVKISGLWTADRHWAASRLRPFVDHMLDTIGAERVMYGSNLPVEAVNCPLHQQFTQLAQILAERAETQWRWLFSDTARRVYRLPQDSDAPLSPPVTSVPDRRLT